MVRQQPDGTTQLVAGRVGAADDHGVDHHHQLVGTEAVAFLLGRDQVGDQVVLGIVAAVGDQATRVLVEFGLSSLDHVEFLEHVAVEDAQHVFGETREELPVRSRCAEELADDRDRVRLADVDRDVGSARRRDCIDEFVDHLADERPQPVGRPR